MSDDEIFEQVDSGASGTFPLPANDLRVGGYAMLKGFPCRVVNIAISKTGKHGHAKAAITGIDIFTSKKYEEVVPTSHSVQSFNPTKTVYTLLDITETGLSLMSNDGEIREDLNLPEDDEDLVKSLNNLFNEGCTVNVTVLSAIGKEKIVDCRKD